MIYPNGISMTLPEEQQVQFLRTIRGLEHVDMLVPGGDARYAGVL